ncbi:MAG: sulfite exporter TauE/SafE family protein [Myxococcota bacterium]
MDSQTLAATAAYLSVGLGAGFVAGLLGIGGGIVIVPLLLIIFSHLGYGDIDLVFPLATGTSLAVIVPTSATSAWTHHHNGNVRWKSVLALIPAGLAAVHGASIVAMQTAGATLRSAFGALMIIACLQMLFFTPRQPAEGRPPPGWLTFLFIGALSGAISYFFGVGGGIVAVPLLVLLGRAPIHKAVGTSSALIVFLALYGTGLNVWLGRSEAGLPAHTFGYVHLVAAGCLMPTSILMARAGALVANVAPAALLRRVFALLLGAEGIRLLVG